MGVLTGIYFVVATTAFRLTPIAYVGSLKRLSVIAVLIFAVWILRERTNLRSRWLWSSVIVAGSACLAFDPTQANLIASTDAYFLQLLGK